MSGIGATARVRLHVVARRQEAAEFAAAVGADPAAPRLPTTYPVRWLTHPDIVAAVRRLAADRPEALPVHELQTVETLAPLPFDRPLTLSATATRTDDVHLTLEATASDGGTPLVRLHAVLRLVP